MDIFTFTPDLIFLCHLFNRLIAVTPNQSSRLNNLPVLSLDWGGLLQWWNNNIILLLPRAAVERRAATHSEQNISLIVIFVLQASCFSVRSLSVYFAIITRLRTLKSLLPPPCLESGQGILGWPSPSRPPSHYCPAPWWREEGGEQDLTLNWTDRLSMTIIQLIRSVTSSHDNKIGSNTQK